MNIQWLMNRLSEKTTWLSIFAVLGLLGMNIAPEYRDHIIEFLIAAASFVAFVFRENERHVSIHLPVIATQEQFDKQVAVVESDTLRQQLLEQLLKSQTQTSESK